MRIGFRGVPRRNRPWTSRTKFLITLGRFRELPDYLERLGISIYGFPIKFFPNKMMDGVSVADVTDVMGCTGAMRSLSSIFNKKDITTIFYLPSDCELFDEKNDVWFDYTRRLVSAYGYISSMFNDSYVVFDVSDDYVNDDFDVLLDLLDELNDDTRRRLAVRNNGCSFDTLRSIYHRFKFPIYLNIGGIRKTGCDLSGDDMKLILDSWSHEMIMEYGNGRGEIDSDDFWDTFHSFNRFVDVVINDSMREKSVRRVISDSDEII